MQRRNRFKIKNLHYVMNWKVWCDDLESTAANFKVNKIYLRQRLQYSISTIKD